MRAIEAEVDMRLQPKTLEERVGELEKDLAIIVATKGTLRLCTEHVRLIWTILLALGALGLYVVQAGWETKQNTNAIIAISQDVRTHVAGPGHAVSLERISALQSGVTEIKTMLVQMQTMLNRRIQ